jgi:type IV secretory pathway TraG/TraD family ATPase VirD4
MAVTEQDLRKGHASTATAGGVVGGASFLLANALEATAGNGLLDLSAAAGAAVPIGCAVGGAMIAGTVGSAFYTWSYPVWLRRQVRPDGWINALDLLTEGGARGIKKEYANNRPDLAKNGKPGRGAKAGDYGLPVGRLVTGDHLVRGQQLYIPHNYSTLVLGISGSGKTQFLVNGLLDLPGAAYVSSTSVDLYEQTARVRAELGRVRVFNPQGVGNVPTDVGWNPLMGCEVAEVAQRRAEAFVRGGSVVAGDNADFWAEQGVSLLRMFLMAAALGGKTMETVGRWAASPNSTEALVILEANPDRAPAAWADELRSALFGDGRLLDHSLTTVKHCLGFLSIPAMKMICNPPSEKTLDPVEFIKGNGTIYAIADDEDRRLAPIITALTEWLQEEAKQLALTMPGKKLSPGFEMVLDEVAQTTPVPLDKWISEKRKYGIGFRFAIQALAQLRKRYGIDGTETILGARFQVALGGLNPKDAEYFVDKAGAKPELAGSTTTDADGEIRSTTSSTRASESPIITKTVLQQLRPWHALVVGVRYKPAIVKFPRGYKRSARAHAVLDRTQARTREATKRQAAREWAAAEAQLRKAAVKEDA